MNGDGSERQRVAVARAMIHRPRVIFADEPTGLLDRRTGLQVMALLRGYREQGSLIAVTHNPEILSEADLVITLRDGQTTRAEGRLARATQVNLA
jgi:ABC-type lipoprotein export system ATPase subunit